MQTVIIVIHLFVVLALIGVVLLQKSEGGALGMGGGGGGTCDPRRRRQPARPDETATATSFGTAGPAVEMRRTKRTRAGFPPALRFLGKGPKSPSSNQSRRSRG